MSKYSKIVNPKTGRLVNVNSRLGKNILKKYLSLVGGMNQSMANQLAREFKDMKLKNGNNGKKKGTRRRRVRKAPKPASTTSTPKPASTTSTPKPASTTSTPKPASTQSQHNPALKRARAPTKRRRPTRRKTKRPIRRQTKRPTRDFSPDANEMMDILVGTSNNGATAGVREVRDANEAMRSHPAPPPRRPEPAPEENKGFMRSIFGRFGF